MKLPNDLIKATDYSKAKDREIHEFECKNGKYIHKYVLGGEHELTPQEVVDCLNALSTIDCDLQTAYAYIQGQRDKVTDLEAKLAELNKEPLNCSQLENGMSLCIIQKSEIAKLKQQLAEKEKEIEEMKHFKVTIGTMENNQVDISSTTYTNQDKISFALEQLEKVKEYIESDKDWKVFAVIGLTKQFIDNQIEELKKENK